MPVEGHFARLSMPLSARDKRVLAVVGIAVVIAAVVLAAVLLTRPSRSSAGCVVATFPSTMGGATLRSCGAAAHTLCRTRGPYDPSIAGACLLQGFAADLRRGASTTP